MASNLTLSNIDSPMAKLIDRGIGNSLLNLRDWNKRQLTELLDTSSEVFENDPDLISEKGSVIAGQITRFTTNIERLDNAISEFNTVYAKVHGENFSAGKAVNNGPKAVAIKVRDAYLALKKAQ